MPGLVGVCRLLLESKGEKFEVLFDEEDRGVVEGHLWHVRRVPGSRLVYAQTNILKGACRTTKLMHRFITGAPHDMDVDHANGNGLDNRRCNLRVCSTQENVQNRGPNRTNPAKFKGVTMRSRTSGVAWEARCGGRGVEKFLGSFQSAEEAARAYDLEAIRLYGEFARPNFPRGDYE